MRAFRLAALVLCLIPASAGAQALWPRPLAGAGEIGLEWVRPTFDGEEGIGFTRGVWVFDGRAKVGQRLNLILAFPYINAPVSGSGGGAAGNPLFGVEFTDTTGRPEFTVGLRRGNFSGSSFGAYIIGALGDYDRLEQVGTDGWILSTVGHVRPWSAPDGGFAELRFGVTGFFMSEGGASSTSMLLDYGIRMGREKGALGFGAGLTGRWPLTGTTGGSVASAVHQVFADASYLKGIVQPTVGVRFPFDEDLGELLSYALTFGVKVVIK
jgi:hypothetical protein